MKNGRSNLAGKEHLSCWVYTNKKDIQLDVLFSHALLRPVIFRTNPGGGLFQYLFRTAVTDFSHTAFAVFNGIFGTQIDAGHAVGAAVRPEGKSLLQADIA